MSDSGSTQQRLNNGGDHNHLADDGGGGGGGGAKLPANNDVMSVSMSAAVELENDSSGRKRSAGAGGVSYSKRSKLRKSPFPFCAERGFGVVELLCRTVKVLFALFRPSQAEMVTVSASIARSDLRSFFGPSCILRTEALKQTQHSNNNGPLLYLVSLGRVFFP